MKLSGQEPVPTSALPGAQPPEMRAETVRLQELASFFWEGPDSRRFRKCGPHMVSSIFFFLVMF